MSMGTFTCTVRQKVDILKFYVKVQEIVPLAPSCTMQLLFSISCARIQAILITIVIFTMVIFLNKGIY